MLGPNSGACFFTLSYHSNLKHIVLIVFLEDGLPEMLSKLGVLVERGIKKSKKHKPQQNFNISQFQNVNNKYNFKHTLKKSLSNVYNFKK